MDRKLHYKIEDFLRDDEFISYALNISSEARADWESLLKEYPPCVANNMALAKAILNGEELTCTLTPDEDNELKQRILKTVSTL